MGKIKVKILSFMLCLMMCFSLVACGGDDKNKGNQGGSGNGGSGNGGGGSTSSLTAEQVLNLAKNTFSNKTSFEISMSEASGQNTTTSTIQVKTSNSYVYINKVNQNSSKTYEKVTGGKYAVKTYDLVNKTYTVDLEINEESYYDVLFSVFAITDWNAYYNAYLKNDSSSVSVSENNGKFTVTIVSTINNDADGSSIKNKIALNVSNNALNSLKIEKYSIGLNNEEILRNSQNVNFNYSANIDFEISQYTLYQEAKPTKSVEELLKLVKSAFTGYRNYSSYVYKLESSEEIEIKTNKISSQKDVQLVKFDEEKILYMKTNEFNEVIYREYDLTEMTYTEIIEVIDYMYNIQLENYSIVDWLGYLESMKTESGYEVVSESIALENSDFEYQVSIKLEKQSTRDLIEFNLFISNDRLLKVEHITDEETIYAEYTYNIDASDLQINQDEFEIV